MKIYSKFSIVILIIGITSLFYSCGDTVTTGDIPEISMSIPAALTAEASKTASKATSAGGTAEDFFEPFRNSLEIAEELLTGVKDIITSLNATVVPDAWTGTQDNGDSVVVTTDTGRDYSKRIEFTSSGSASPYLQINYNPGTVKGIIYYTEEDATSSLENIKAFYDETGAYPVLTIWLTIVEGSAGDTYPVSLYFNATMNADGNYVIEGGASYNFVFGDEPSFSDYSAEHTYMFKAFANSDGTKAKVSLYFPLSTVSTVTESHDIKSSFLDIIYTWLETDNSQDLDGASWLNSGDGTITDGETLGEQLALYSGSVDDDIEFVLQLNNPIAYYSVDGYMGNGDTYPTHADYSLGDLDTIDFTLSPVSIEALDSDTATFTFLAD